MSDRDIVAPQEVNLLSYLERSTCHVDVCSGRSICGTQGLTCLEDS